jgi:hypothetical protein
MPYHFKVFSRMSGPLRRSLMVVICDADVAKIQHLAEISADIGKPTFRSLKT